MVGTARGLASTCGVRGSRWSHLGRSCHWRGLAGDTQGRGRSVTLLLSCAYVVSIVTAGGIGLYVLRGSHLTLSGLAVATYLTSAMVWSGVALWNLFEPFGDNTARPVRILFWGAVFVAGIRSLLHVMADPLWVWRPRDIVNLVAHPLIMGVIVAFPTLHRLVVVPDGSGQLSYAPGFWIHSAVGLVLLLRPIAASFGLTRGMPSLSPRTTVYRGLAWSLPMIGYAVSAVMWGPNGPFLAPAFFVLPTVIIGTAVVKDGLVDKVPLARGEVFENLTGAVFVTDSTGRVIDVNAAARRLAASIDGATDLTGRLLEEACPTTARVLDADGEKDVPDVLGGLVLSVSASPIVDGRGRVVGRSVIAGDITEAVLQRRELERMHEALSHEAHVSEQLRAELASQLMRDLASGLYNRRYLANALPGAIESCTAEGSDLSVVILDIDDFKLINDTRGHAAGDRVVVAVARALEASSSGGAVVRYGGDEFLVLMPGVSAVEAFGVAEGMRAACAALRVDARDGAISLTLSAGVSTARGGVLDSDALMEAADAALYRAKEAGRDRTSL